MEAAGNTCPHKSYTLSCNKTDGSWPYGKAVWLLVTWQGRPKHKPRKSHYKLG